VVEPFKVVEPVETAAADLIRDRRVQYETAGLDVGDVAADPIEQLLRWHAEAFEAEVAEPNAMVLATVDPSGAPSARAVLVRGIDARGLTFFTNYRAPKSLDLTSNSKASGLFVWLDLHRQVRVSGRAEHVTPAESDDYFASRPRASQIGAWASPQSQVLAGRADLDARIAHYADEFAADQAVPRPPDWGGWRIVPDQFEFWQGRPSRLHDRLRYRRDVASETWLIERLAP